MELVNSPNSVNKVNDLRTRFSRRASYPFALIEKKGHHIAPSCHKPRVVLHFAREDNDLELLEPYMHSLEVNGRQCKFIRDSAATIDVVHSLWVSPEDYPGECAWIKQPAQEESVCLPLARVTIRVPFRIARD